MEKKTDSLLFKFGIIFLIFILVTLLTSGFNTYYNQNSFYKQQCEENIQRISAYLNELIKADGKDFLAYQKYILEHKDEILIPADFNGDWQPAQEHFENLFAEHYPEKTLHFDIQVEELDKETQIAYGVYSHEYWLSTFNKAKEAFGVAYVYYIVPAAEKNYMIWMIDGLDITKEIDGKKYVSVCDTVLEKPEEHKKMWEAWNIGKTPEGYDTYDNEYGKTYAYYLPVYVEGKKIGVIGTEIEIDIVNRDILHQSLWHLVGLATILIACVGIMLLVINEKYISKLSHLQTNVKDYALNKNPKIAGNIEKEIDSNDEISSLAMQISAMILEMDNYMNSLTAATEELSSTKERADRMKHLAHTDALTGMRNKTAYDNETGRLDWAIEDGHAEFGIAMIDLNFLKRINDTYGHEQGNIAIKKLCRIVCNIFKNSPVFRVGGDEFVVILENEDYENAEFLIEEFDKVIDKLSNDMTLEPWERVSASIGVAIYDENTDNSTANVFKRADKAMYLRKRAMKAMRT